jgi:hypothetical protein
MASDGPQSVCHGYQRTEDAGLRQALYPLHPGADMLQVSRLDVRGSFQRFDRKEDLP